MSQKVIRRLRNFSAAVAVISAAAMTSSVVLVIWRVTTPVVESAFLTSALFLWLSVSATGILQTYVHKQGGKDGW